MEYIKFSNWLIKEKDMSVRSAKDVISRYGRVCRIINHSSIDERSLKILQQESEYLNSSMYVKSQLKRAIALYLEFIESEEG